jgi:hypothetical protein
LFEVLVLYVRFVAKTMSSKTPVGLLCAQKDRENKKSLLQSKQVVRSTKVGCTICTHIITRRLGVPTISYIHNNPRMKGNQGLEALAALCGGQSDVPTEEVASTSMVLGARQAAANAAQAPDQAAGALAQQRQAAQATQQQTALLSLTPQQWQALAVTLQSGGVNSALGLALAAQQQAQQQAQQHAQQQQQAQHQAQQQAVQAQQQAVQAQQQAAQAQQQKLGENAAIVAMQQLAYFQYIQAQARFAAQTMVGTTSNAAVSLVDPAQQAIALALAGKSHQQQRPQQHGESHLGGSTCNPVLP